MMKLNTTRYRNAALVLLAGGIVAACDNPVGEGSHVNPETFAIRQNGTLLVQGTQAAATGQIALQLNQTLPVTVHFYRQGQELTIPQGYHLAFAGTLVEWEPAVAGGFTGTLRGAAAGTGTIRLRLMHGPLGSGHEDFGSNINVVVTGAVAAAHDR